MNNKDITVLIFRIIAAAFILICHIGTALNNGVIAQTFVVGVQFFLFISGYLYGNKDIKEPWPWIKKKYNKLITPIILYVLICLFVSLIIEINFSWFSVPLYLFFVNGYYHLFEFLPNIALIGGTEHLWFLTVIFVCYILLVFVKKIKFNVSRIRFFFLMFFIFIITFVFSYFGARFDYILVFFIGYGIKRSKSVITKTYLLLSFIVAALLVAIRLLLKSYCDANGDIPIYTQVVVPLSLISITVFAFFLLHLFVGKTKDIGVFKRVYESKFISFCSDITFCVYISHYIFINGKTSVFNLECSLLFKILLFLVCSIVFSLILFYVCKIILLLQKKLLKKIGVYQNE